jgi:diketogulonate reductase-like aldo/keto reductase
MTADRSSGELRTREARGASVPVPGFGTWQLSGDEVLEILPQALEMGYRHIDTAEAYDNEAEIGTCLEESGIPRREIFLASKISPRHYISGDFRLTVEAILKRLRTDHLDLLLLHWPAFRGTTLEATIERLNAVRDEGLVLHIGVSNFTIGLLDRAWSATTHPLAVNQVEYHPFLDQDKLLAEMEGREMILAAYSPLAQGRTARNRVLEEIGEAHGKTGPQVALRWLVQRGTVPLPRTSDPRHARENLEVFDFELSESEMGRVGELHEPAGRIVDPAGDAPDWD